MHCYYPLFEVSKSASRPHLVRHVNATGGAVSVTLTDALWAYSTADEVTSSPAVGSDGTIYFGSTDGFVYAVTADGALKWRTPTNNAVDIATPAIGDEGEPSAVDRGVSPEEAVAQAELRKMVIEALEELPSDERELVRRHYLEGERFDHVAASLGLSKSWGSRLHTRAVARLTKRLRSLAK